MYLQTPSVEAHYELAFNLITKISSPDKKGLLIIWGAYNRETFSFLDDTELLNETEWTILRLPHPEFIFRWANNSQIHDIRSKLEAYASSFEPELNTKHWRRDDAEPLSDLEKDQEDQAQIAISSKKRADFSATMKRLWQNPEYRLKMSESAKRRWENPEQRLRVSEYAIHRWENDEYRLKMSESSKRRWEDPEYRLKTTEAMSESNKRRWENDEYRLKMSETLSKSAKRQWENDEYRLKMSESSKRQWENKEFRLKMSEVASETAKRRRGNEEIRLNIIRGRNKSLQEARQQQLAAGKIKPGFACYISESCGFTSKNKIHVGTHVKKVHSDFTFDPKKSPFVNERFQIVSGSVTCYLCTFSTDRLAPKTILHHFKRHHPTEEYDEKKVTMVLIPTGEKIQWEMKMDGEEGDE